MFGDKKKLAALILKGAGDAPPVDEPDSGDDGLETAMEEFLSAVSGKSAAGMAAALRSAFDMLESKPEAEPMPEEEGGFH